MAIPVNELRGKRALIRVDFNVPLNEALEVTDDTRIRAAMPTIRYVLEHGGSAVLMSHLGRPKQNEAKFSLQHIVPAIERHLGKSVIFAGDCISAEARAITASMKPGDVVLLENLRYHNEEKQGDEFFAGQLAEHGDLYINDAFGTAHRAHASTAVIARFFQHAKYFGLLMEAEVTSIQRVLNATEKPVTAIIGGAKISDKLLIVENLLEVADHIIIGGGMSYTFFKALGGEIGDSLCEDDRIETCRNILSKAEAAGVVIHLPVDAVIADRFAHDAETKTAPSNAIAPGWMGLDIGTEARKQFTEIIENSKIVLWNGPMGVFEMDAFSKGTETIAHALAAATKQGCFTLVGGGDSVSALNKCGLADAVSYVSTGGGAMLESLEGKVLPGIAAIQAVG
jgi:phosphoglycerate kinase